MLVDDLAAGIAYRAAFPEHDVWDVRLLGEGWDCVVYLVNDAFALRFLKNPRAARAMATEIRLLPFLRDRVPLSIQQPAVVGIHPFERSWPFMGYPSIAGVELTRERFWALPARVRHSIMQSLAAFLEALHAVDVNAARERGVTARNVRAEFGDVFARREALVAPALEPHERATFIARIRAIVTDERFDAIPTLIHGDMSPEHILYDGATHRITGIIDFGDAAIADPDYDLMYLLEDYGEPFLAALLQYNRHTDPAGLLHKLRAFRLFDAARHTLAGHTRNDTKIVREGLADLNDQLRDEDARSTKPQPHL